MSAIPSCILQQFDNARNAVGFWIARIKLECAANIPLTFVEIEFRQPRSRTNPRSVSCSIVGVRLNRLAEPLDRLSRVFVCHPSKPVVIDSPKEALESLDIVRRPSPRRNDTCVLHPSNDGCSDFRHYFIERIP